MNEQQRIKALRDRIAELEARIAECAYKEQGMHPHPHWKEERERLENDMSVLKRNLNVLLHKRPSR